MSFEDMLERAKAKPNALTYTINAQGSIHHLLTEWVSMEAGVRMTPIPYRGSAPALTDVLGGRVDVMVDTATSAVPAHQCRSDACAGAVVEGSLSADAGCAHGARASCPASSSCRGSGSRCRRARRAAIVERLASEVHRALALPDVQKKLVEGGNVATPLSPQEFRDRVAREIKSWSRVIAAAGIKAGEGAAA